MQGGSGVRRREGGNREGVEWGCREGIEREWSGDAGRE